MWGFVFCFSGKNFFDNEPAFLTSAIILATLDKKRNR